ncbi:unnamed protein product [Parajaminaea phylloscopi]
MSSHVADCATAAPSLVLSFQIHPDGLDIAVLDLARQLRSVVLHSFPFDDREHPINPGHAPPTTPVTLSQRLRTPTVGSLVRSVDRALAWLKSAPCSSQPTHYDECLWAPGPGLSSLIACITVASSVSVFIVAQLGWL